MLVRLHPERQAQHANDKLNFNSILVRLHLWFLRERANPDRVSIPYWYDYIALVLVNHKGNNAVSIP